MRLFLWLALLCSDVLSRTSPDQYDALYTLYNLTDGVNWSFKLQPWNFSYSNDPCDEKWEGIACNDTIFACRNSTCGITKIFLPGMGLRHHIPDCLTALTNLEVLALQNNMLSGPIPDFVGSLFNLTILSLSNNSLTHSIPSSIADLNFLIALDLNTNLLSGSIPAEFEHPSFQDSLVIFYLGENQLHGMLPSSLAGMSKLRQLYVTENHLSGPLPLLCNLDHLDYLGLATNALTGSMPACLGTNTALKNLYMNYNSLGGSIPSSLGNISTLAYLETGGNWMQGRIPSELGLLSNVLVIELFSNEFTGSIPSALGSLIHMHTLQLQENCLTGTIPPELGNITALNALLLFTNSLTGTIPGAIGNNSLLEELTIYKNSLSGYIPSSILRLTALRNLLVQDNELKGMEPCQSEGGHCELNLSNLQHLDISDNMFTGVIPKDIFTKLPSILSVAAIKNCFSGILPDEICQAQSLQVLALDGLASGTKCRKRLADPLGFIDTYLIKSLDGSIPSCIWRMTNLTVIHLSGNGLTGTIPRIPLSSKLLNISVSHNRITGTVPHSLRTFPFVELDLSYNKLGGVFRDEITKEEADSVHRTIFRIETNRLSGWVPGSLDHVESVKVVTGNLFDCDSAHPLPSSDPDRKEYVCGSRQLDQMLIMWAFIFSFAAFGAVAVRCTWTHMHATREDTHNGEADERDVKPGRSERSPTWTDGMVEYCARVVVWFRMEELELWGCNEDMFPSLFTFMALIRMLRNTSLVVTAVIVVVGVPFYILIKTYLPQYSTHEHQYGWMYSAAFLTGVVPAVLLLVLFCSVCCITSSSVVMLFPQQTGAENRLSMFFRETFVSSGRNSYRQNMMSGRVSSSQPSRFTTPRVDSSMRPEASTASRLFIRTCWHLAIVLGNMITCLCVNGVYVYTLLAGNTYQIKVVAKVVMAVFQLSWNMFVVPKVVDLAGELLADMSSQKKWMAASMLLFNNIVAPALATAVTDDSCYNSLFTSRDKIEAYYSYPYCAVYAVDVVTEERVCYSTSVNGLSTSFTPPFIYNYQCASSMLVNFTPVFFLAYAILAVIPPLVLLVMSAPAVAKKCPIWLLRSVPSIFWPPGSAPHHMLLGSTLIKPDRIVTNLMSHMPIHLTYGVASPLLAFVMSAAVVSITSLHLSVIGRLLHHQYHTRAVDASGGLEAACMSVMEGLPACLWTILVGSALVFSSIIEDFAGDEVGWQMALAVAIPTWMVPATAYVALRYAIWDAAKRKHTDSLLNSIGSLESESRQHLLSAY